MIDSSDEHISETSDEESTIEKIPRIKKLKKSKTNKKFKKGNSNF